MKKLIAFVTAALICAALSLTLSANVGPVFWQGYPSSEVLLIDKESSISVLREQLVFDFTDEQYTDYSLTGRVSAVYRMQNPADAPEHVQMAFPFISVLDTLNPQQITILADRQQLPFELYLGDEVKSGEAQTGVDFSDVVAAVSQKEYQPRQFDANAPARLYRIQAKPREAQEAEFVVDFDYDPQKTKVLYRGFNSFENTGSHIRLAQGGSEWQPMDLLVMGVDVSLSVSANSGGEAPKPIQSFDHEIASAEVSPKAYLLSLLKVQTSNVSALPTERQQYNLYAKELDRVVEHGAASAEELQVVFEQPRIVILVYKVDFPADSTREVAVVYPATGTMNRKNPYTSYTFEYLFSPAQYWSGFANLTVIVMPPPSAPILAQSTLPFRKQAENYVVRQFSLPKQDLSFTLYTEEYAFFNRYRPYLYGGVVFIFAVILFSIIRKTALKRRSHK